MGFLRYLLLLVEYQGKSFFGFEGVVDGQE
jgi:hypothetical protein